MAGARTINFNFTSADLVGRLTSYDLIDNEGYFVFQQLPGTTLLLGLTLSISPTANTFELTNIPQSASWSVYNPQMTGVNCPNSFDNFSYPNFSSTSGLSLVSTAGVTNNWLYLTTATNNDVGNMYRSTAIRFNRSFSLTWVFECSGGSGADGFCLQWTTTNNTNGGGGGSIGYVASSSTINAILFKTYTNNSVTWLKNNVSQITQAQAISFRQTVYYWADYDDSAKTLKLYYSSTNSKPGSSQHLFTSFSFDSANYYIGFGADTGGANDNQFIKSFTLTFA